MVLLDEKSTRRTETAVIAISSSVFALCLQIYGYTRPWYDWGRIASLPISAGFAITSLVLAQEDIRANRRQRQTQSVNDDIYSCGLETYRTTTMEEIVGTRQPSPDHYMGEVVTVDSLPQPEPPEPSQLEFYNLAQDLPDEAVGVLICGNSGAGKTCAAVELAGVLTQSTPAEIIVLDPHYNDNWEQKGLQSIGDIPHIENALQSLITELDHRFQLKKKRQPVGDPIIIITDEIGACLKRFDDEKVIKNTLERFGAEGRKVNMFYIGILHSTNVGDTGNMSAAMRSNYLVLNLCKSAKNYAKHNWKDDEFAWAKQWVKKTDYCAVIAGVDDMVCEHPTHSHHKTFKAKGNPPIYKHQIHQIPWTIIDSRGNRLSESQSDQYPPKSTETHRPNPSDFNLEKDPEPPIDPLPEISEGETLARKILEWCISKGGQITLGQLKNNTRWAKYFSDEVLLSAFSALQENSLAEYIVEEKTAGKISHILKVMRPE